MAKFIFPIYLYRVFHASTFLELALFFLLLIDLCHIHIEAKVLGHVSLLKPTVIILIFNLFLAKLSR